MRLFLTKKLLLPAASALSSRRIHAKLRDLSKSQEQQWPNRQALIVKRIHHILSYSSKHVPYYRDLFQDINFDPENVLNDIKFIQELPFLTKDILREQGLRMVSAEFAEQALHIRKTGGSTGPTLPTYYSDNALDWSSAAHLYIGQKQGRQLGKKTVQLSSQLGSGSAPIKDRLIEQTKSLILNKIFLKYRSFAEAELYKIYDRLKRERPYSVQGHPSTLLALADLLSKLNISAKGLFQVFESTGETLDLKKADSIKATYGCSVYNRLGYAEFGAVAHSEGSSPNRLKVLDLVAFPESCSLGNGLEELVFTGLTNFAMPLIRYRTGDVGKLSFEMGDYWISNIQGRVHDIVNIAGTTIPTHYFQDFMDSIGCVHEFQFVQSKDGSLLLKIVPKNVSSTEVIRASISQKFGESFKIEFTDFAGLTLQGWRSKFRYVVQSS
jgi:phenylacetate-CoA ligase